MSLVAAFLAALTGMAPPPLPEPPVVAFFGPKPPWLARRRAPDKDLEPGAFGLREVLGWPAEPASPTPVSQARLAAALGELCGWMPPGRAAKYAEWILAASTTFGVDPFLLGALAYEPSRCEPKFQGNAGLGLTAVSLEMHQQHLQHRRYRYWALMPWGWQRRELPLSEFLFYDKALVDARSNLYFAAALLRIATEQCPFIDGAFGSIAHRHPVSHYVWGDRVRGTGDEDRVLCARRRLVAYYLGSGPSGGGRIDDLALTSPLDGAPRVITSGLGDPRAGGARTHLGIDFASNLGEPVRAVAPGRVVVAGVDLRSGPAQSLPLDKARQLPMAELGAGGFLVMVRHAGEITSAFMHLDDYVVAAGQVVVAGTLLGHVGKTGVRHSQPHLHFELRRAGKHLDPLAPLGLLAIGPDRTWHGFRQLVERDR